MTDGTSNTILVFETDVLVTWTEPEDIRWTPGGRLPNVTSPHPGGTHVLFAEGAARFIQSTIAPQVLLALLTINGNEVIGGG
jgi:hypothetical protein